MAMLGLVGVSQEDPLNSGIRGGSALSGEVL
jgi:hypothetical protein